MEGKGFLLNETTMDLLDDLVHSMDGGEGVFAE